MSLSQVKQNKRISYSQLKIWNECPYKHKLSYIDEINKFKGNEFTAFGTAVHTVCEELAKGTSSELRELFLSAFSQELSYLDEVEMPPDKIKEFEEQGLAILPELENFLVEYFPGWEVFSTEEELLEEIVEFENYEFKGFIDLVLKKENKYIILDWKTCSWGWNAQKKSDPIVVYQLMLYKKYFAQKHDIPLDDIETYFGLLKRTANKSRIEIFKLTSGDRRMSNSSALLEKAIINIKNKIKIKNRLSCKYCQYYKTEHCP